MTPPHSLKGGNMPRILKVEMKDTKGKETIEIVVSFSPSELPLRSDSILEAVNNATAPFIRTIAR